MFCYFMSLFFSSVVESVVSIAIAFGCKLPALAHESEFVGSCWSEHGRKTAKGTLARTKPP